MFCDERVDTLTRLTATRGSPPLAICAAYNFLQGYWDPDMWCYPFLHMLGGWLA